MADSYVQVAVDGAGKKIDNAALQREPETPGATGETVYRQRTVLSDDENPRLQAKVEGEAGNGALKVRAASMEDVYFELVQIRELLQMIIGN
jgi:hypothetical protein